MVYFVSFLKETLNPENVLSGGGQLPLGGMEITSEMHMCIHAGEGGEGGGVRGKQLPVHSLK